MTKVYIGIDAHKDSNVVALAFAGKTEPEIYGKVSADLDRFLTALRKIKKQHNLNKDDILLCYEAGPSKGSVEGVSPPNSSFVFSAPIKQ